MKYWLETLQPLLDVFIRTIPAFVFGGILYILFYPYRKREAQMTSTTATPPLRSATGQGSAAEGDTHHKER